MNDTPIHLASLTGHLKIVMFFISDLKCDPNIPGDNNCTPLHKAASEDRLGVVKYLIEEQHCDPLCTDMYSNTPLHVHGFQKWTLKYCEVFKH